MMSINLALTGAVILAALTISLFFLKFWKTTHDRFFLFFSAAFFLDAISRIILAVIDNNEFAPFVYILRLLMFAIILIAVADKNRIKIPKN